MSELDLSIEYPFIKVIQECLVKGIFPSYPTFHSLQEFQEIHRERHSLDYYQSSRNQESFSERSGLF